MKGYKILNGKGEFVPGSSTIHHEDLLTGTDMQVVVADGEFSSGAERSEKKLPWWMLPLDAMQPIIKRFATGAAKYKPHNWKKAIGTNDTEFVRQFVNHINDHWLKFMLHVGDWSTDQEGESPLDNLGAIGWGVIALIYYCLHDQKLVMRSLSDQPEKES